MYIGWTRTENKRHNERSSVIKSLEHRNLRIAGSIERSNLRKEFGQQWPTRNIHKLDDTMVALEEAVVKESDLTNTEVPLKSALMTNKIPQTNHNTY